MKSSFTSLILALSLFLITGTVYAQPANDDCTNAISISTVPYGPTCSASIAAVTTGATQSPQATSCAPTSSNDDIWYSFTATAATHFLRYSNFVRTTGTSGTQIGYTLYSGTCAAPVEIACAISFGSGGSGMATFSGLTSGTTYLLRLFASGASNAATFDFCLQDPPPPPANDECAGAINISTQPYGASCSGTIAGNTTGATQSTPDPSCTSTSNNDDIWYTFTATSTTQYLRYSGMVATFGTATLLSYALYDGACGASQISCVASFGSAGAGSTYLSGLTIGNVYTLRLWTSGTSNAATFNFCLQDAPAAPANDECAGAISLTQNATCTNTAGTTLGATESLPTSTCTGTSDDDVWYSFVATQTDAQIVLSSVTAVIGTSTTLYYQVLSGTCGALTSMMCNTSVTGIVGGLTPGETYYIRVYTSLATSMVNFNICVNELAAAPTTCSTLSAPAAAATVGGTPTLTWSATTNASSYEIYLDANNPPTTLYATVYNNNSTSYTVTTPLSPGVYYWYVLPVNSLGQPASCATVRSFTVVAPPANDDCGSATSLVASPNATCTNTAGTTIGATQSNETATTCNNTGTGDDVWYSFVAVSPIHSVALSGTSTTTAVSIYSGSCGSLVLLDCGSTNAFSTGLTIGATYYVRVYTTSTVSATTTNFNICVTTPPLNDECSGSISMPITTYGAACTYTAVNTTGATQSTETGQANTCTGTGIDDDVWYTFTSTFAGTYTFSYTALTATSGTASTVGMNIYTGTCGALTEVGSACSTGFGSSGTGSRTVVLEAGTTYTLRLYVGSSPNTGTFNFCITAPPAPPANDECSGAIALPSPSATATCTTPTAGTTVGGTQSADAAPSCNATATNDDVWYSFVATATTHTVLITNATSTTAAAIYTGSCGTLTQVASACGSGGATASGLTIGATYLVRVYTTSTVVTTYSDFDICIVSGAPANDDCGGAIALPTPSTNNVCANPVAGTTIGASPSDETAPTCSATGTNDDVWYSFVATSTNHAVVITNATSTTAAALYSGSCGTLTQVDCGSGTTGSAQGTALTPGNTYYVRVYTTSATVGIYSNFDICIVSAPSNDNCAGAISLSVSANNACTAATPGSTLGATLTTGEATSTCSESGMNDDVWYSFVATATTHTVSLGDPTSTSAATVYSGSCGTLVQVACASTNTIATGLTIGETYYVRVYTTSAVVGTYSNFNICIGVLPTNDDCAGAISLTASSGGTCNAVAGSTVGATATTGETATTCSSTGTNDDVWYSFEATSTTHTVNILDASTTTAATIYSGTCGSLVLVSCASTMTTATGLTIGQVYYVRVYSTVSTATTYSNFNICVYGTPANDDCVNAVTLTNNVSVNGSNYGATQSLAPEDCGASTPTAANDVWYQFTALSSGSALIAVNNVSASFDAVVQVYSGTCGALTSIGCADGPGDGGSETVSLNGLVAGQTYYVRVYGYTTTDFGTFTITVSGAAVPITIEYFRGAKQNSGNFIEWKVNCTNTSTATMQLERSTDSRRFEAINNITASAAQCLQPFSYTDLSPSRGVNYYRLKSTDADGRITYSSTIAIINADKGFAILSLSPNPAQSKTYLHVASATSSSMMIMVSDVSGKQLLSESVKLVAGSNQVPVNVARLASGMYYLTALTSDGERKTMKFVKE